MGDPRFARMTEEDVTLTRPRTAAPPLLHVIQRERKRPKNPPNGSTMITTTYSKTLLSFSRSARESPGWFCRGNDDVLLCP